MKMTVAFYTLGCKANQFETQALERLFSEKGHTVVPFSQPADIYIVNTCTVTAASDRKARAAMRRAKSVSPQSLLAVCGCYSQIAAEEIGKMGIADIVLGSSDKSRLVELAEEAFRKGNAPLPDVNEDMRRTFDFMPAGSLIGRTRAMLKIQDGCQNYCAYCIIPFARGLSRSLPFDLAVSEASRLYSEGYKEIILTGIEISSYGLDLPEKPALEALITAIAQAAPGVRLRLGSLEPRTVTEDFCKALSKIPSLCPHFHISLQSGCDKTLSAMRRKYSTARYYESCLLLRRYFPGCSITTDLIVGFPGESDEDFAETLDFLAKCDFAQVHIFPYSRRAGTAADRMPVQLTSAQKEARAKEAGALCTAMEQRYLRSLIGTVQSVLFEKGRDGAYPGHCPQYCPVICKGHELAGHIKSVLITGLGGDSLTGELVCAPLSPPE